MSCKILSGDKIEIIQKEVSPIVSKLIEDSLSDVTLTTRYIQRVYNMFMGEDFEAFKEFFKEYLKNDGIYYVTDEEDAKTLEAIHSRHRLNQSSMSKQNRELLDRHPFMVKDVEFTGTNSAGSTDIYNFKTLKQPVYYGAAELSLPDLVEMRLKALSSLVEFEEETHKYYYKGREANKTASSLTEKADVDSKYEEKGKISAVIGNQVDDLIRKLIADSSYTPTANTYPNLSETLIEQIIDDTLKLKKSLEKEGYKLLSDEYRLMSTRTNNDGIVEYIGGTPDLIAVSDKDNKVIVIDVKTRFDGKIGDRQIDSWTSQTGFYASVIRGMMQGRKNVTVETAVFPIGVNYTYTQGTTYTIKDNVVTDAENNVLQASYVPLNSKYKPELGETTIPLTEGTSYTTTPLKESQVEESILASMKASGESLPLQAVQRVNEYIPLTPRELNFVGNHIAVAVSSFLDSIITDPGLKEDWFGDDYPQDLTTMDRKDILKLPGLLHSIINVVVEQAFIDNVPPSKAIQANWIVTNLEAVIEAGHKKFIELEGVKVSMSKEEDSFTSSDSEFIEDSNDSLEDSIQTEDHEVPTLESYQLKMKHSSARNSLSARIRKFISTIPMKEYVERVTSYADFRGVADEFGYTLQTYVDPTEAVVTITDIVSKANNIEEMIELMRKEIEYNPYLLYIIESLEKDPQLKSAFFSNFKKDVVIRSSTYVRERNGKKVHVTTNLNTKTPFHIIRSKIRNVFRNNASELLHKGNGGKGTINTENLKQFKTILEDLNTALSTTASKKNDVVKEIYPTFKAALEAVGIQMQRTEMLAILNRSIRFHSSGGPFSLNTSGTYKVVEQSPLLNILANLEGIHKVFSEVDPKMIIDPLDYNSKGAILGYIDGIARGASVGIKARVEPSVYHLGKMYYSISTPSYIIRAFNRFLTSSNSSNKEALEKHINSEYGMIKEYNPWLKQMLANSTLAKRIEHRQQLSHLGVKYEDLSSLGYLSSIIHNFFHNPTKSDEEYAYYRVPLLSDKPAEEYVKFKVFKTDKVSSELASIFNFEVTRILTVLDRAYSISTGGMNSDSRIKNYDLSDSDIDKLEDKGILGRYKNKELTMSDIQFLVGLGKGASFHFLSDFNAEVTGVDETGVPISSLTAIIANRLNGGSALVNEELHIKKAIDTMLEVRFNDFMQRAKDMGLFDLDSTTTTPRLQHLPDILSFRDVEVDEKLDIAEALRTKMQSFFYNDFLAAVSMNQILATDLAYYKDGIDYQKRAAQFHSPALKPNTLATAPLKADGTSYSQFANTQDNPVTDGNMRTVYIEIEDKESTSLSNISKALDKKKEDLKKANPGREAEIDQTFVTLKANILSAFGNIDSTDGQAFNSATSYAKKMIAFGKASPDFMEAYSRIKSGNFNLEDLYSVMQPIKPFTYTSMTKVGSKNKVGFDFIKLNAQHKNSEFTLLIAEALAGVNEGSLMAGLSEFMEDTHFDGDTYLPNGIDSIQFSSSVKVGATGVIKITRSEIERIKRESNDQIVTDAEAVKELLRKKLFTKDNYGNTIYNENYVHIYPYDDYGIQQEVPNHFMDDEQLFGSQFRILSVSDIPNGTQVTDRGTGKTANSEELIKEYFELHSQIIEDSANLIKQELFLDSESSLKHNERLSALLKEYILRDNKYSSDLVYAVSLNEQGEFNLPLNDPTHSVKIQEILHAIIKERINKQKTSGGPLVQVSGGLLSEDLNIRWKDAEGNILPTKKEFSEQHSDLTEDQLEKRYAEEVLSKQEAIAYHEAYMALPTEEMEKALTYTYYDSDAKKAVTRLRTPQEALEEGLISEEQLMAIGYRIPTESKYSMIPMKVIGFIPRAVGSTLMLPNDIITLTGSDFDIDKMYVILKSFKKDRITLSRKNMLNILGNLEFYLGSNRSKEELAAISKYILAKLKFKYDKGYEDPDNNNKKYPVIYTDEFNKIEKLVTTTIFSEVKMEEGKTSKEAMYNRIFDINFSLLTTKEVTEDMLNPGNFDGFKDGAYKVIILKNGVRNEEGKLYTLKDLRGMSLDELRALAESSDKLNLINVLDQITLHQRNMVGGKLIGAFANHNVSHAFLSFQDIKLKLDKVSIKFSIGGRPFTLNSDTQLDPMYTFDDVTKVSKNTSEGVASAVDAAKEPVLNFLNINTTTVNTVGFMLRVGLPIEFVGLFLSQPIIEEVLNEYTRQKDAGFASFRSILDQKIRELSGDSKEKTKLASNNEFSDEEFANRFSMDNNSKEAIDLDLQTLLLFKEMYDFGSELGELTFLTKFNSVNNSAGPTNADTLLMQTRVTRFVENNSGAESASKFSAEASRAIANNPILNSFYSNTVGEQGVVKLLLGRHFPHYSKVFQDLIEEIQKNTRTRLDAKTINIIASHFATWYFSKKNADGTYFLDSSMSAREYYAGIGNRSIINDFNILKQYAPDNAFLSSIEVVAIPSLGLYTLESDTSNYSREQLDDVIRAWEELASDPVTRNIAIQLFRMTIFKTGFSFSPKTWGHLASAKLKASLMDYNTVAREMSNVKFGLPIDSFIKQFFRNNSHNPSIVSTIYLKKNEEEHLKDDGSSITFNNLKSNRVLAAKLSTTQSEYLQFINFKGELYQLSRHTEDSATYKKAEKLGDSNNFLEYSFEKSDPESIFSKRRGTVINNITEEVIEEDASIEEMEPYDTEGEISRVANSLAGHAGKSETAQIVSDVFKATGEETSSKIESQVGEKASENKLCNQ